MATSRLTVNLSAVQRNYLTIARECGAFIKPSKSSTSTDAACQSVDPAVRLPNPEAPHIAAVLKADAYGLGSAKVAAALHAVGCRRFCVAMASEAQPIRDTVGDDSRVFVLSGFSARDKELYTNHGLIPCLASMDQMAAFESCILTPSASNSSGLNFGSGSANANSKTSSGDQTSSRVDVSSASSFASPSASMSSGTREAVLQFCTGMNRLGLPRDDILRAIDIAVEWEAKKAASIFAVMTHAACADMIDDDGRHDEQHGRFLEIAAQVEKALGRPVAKTFANSASIFRMPYADEVRHRVEASAAGLPDSALPAAQLATAATLDEHKKLRPYQHDQVRPGLAIYGGNPVSRQPLRENVMARTVDVKVPVLQVHPVEAGEYTGYSVGWVAPAKSTVAVVGAGYADGVLRALGGLDKLHLFFTVDTPTNSKSDSDNATSSSFLYTVRKVDDDGVKQPTQRPYTTEVQVDKVAGTTTYALPVRGIVSMDTLIVDVSAVPADQMPKEGDEFELIGEHQSPEDLAAQAGTISYEILTALGQRYERRYIGGDAATAEALVKEFRKKY